VTTSEPVRRERRVRLSTRPTTSQTQTSRSNTGWERQASVAVAPLVAVGLTTIVMAAMTQQAWLVLVGAPALVVLALDVVMAPPPAISVSSSIARTRVNEGGFVDVEIRLLSPRSGSLRLTIRAVGGARIAAGFSNGAATAEIELKSGIERVELVTIECERWGRCGLEIESIAWPSPIGLVHWSSMTHQISRVWVHPALVPAQSRFGVQKTSPRPGQYRATRRGDGVEYHSSRPYENGDRWRDLDHRTSARRNALWTKTRHVERARDLVLVVDLIADGGTAGEALANQAVRLADGIARDHLGDRDRVGMVVLAQQIGVLGLGDGSRQRDRIVDLLLRSDPRAGVTPLRIGLVRHIPRSATVVVLSPLIDTSLPPSLLELRRQQRDVVVMRLGADLIARYRDQNEGFERGAASLRLIDDAHIDGVLRERGITVNHVDLDMDLAVALDKAQRRHQATTSMRWR